MYGRTASIEWSDDVKPTEFSSENSMDLKFNVQYSLNSCYGSARIGICGLSKDTIKDKLESFSKGITMSRKKSKVSLTLKGGYTGGDGACVGKLFSGTVFSNTITSGPDYWLNMECLAQDAQVHAQKNYVINSPTLIQTACTQLCMNVLNIPCVFAVENEEIKKAKIHEFNSIALHSLRYADVARQIMEWGNGKLRCWVDPNLTKASMIVIDNYISPTTADLVSKAVGCPETKKYSCLGVQGKRIVYGIPKMINNGIEIDTQLDFGVKRGMKFTVESDVLPEKFCSTPYFVVKYEHIGHLRGNEWRTHIRGMLLDKKAFIR